MKKITGIFTFIFLLGFLQLAFSEEIKPGLFELQQVEAKIELVISDQIKAFTLSDVDRAYYHASKSIKAIFPNSEIFGLMVKKSYPMIWAPKEYKFLSTSHLANGVVQKVMFTDSRGGMHFFDYALQNDGKRWVISGVYMVQGEEGV